MSGTLIINDDLAWIPAGWAFRAAMERTWRLIDRDLFPGTTSSIERGMEPQIINLVGLNKDEFQGLFDTLVRAYDQLLQEKGKGFESAHYYEEFLKAFRSLLALVSEDPRVGKPVYPEAAKYGTPTVSRFPPK